MNEEGKTMKEEGAEPENGVRALAVGDLPLCVPLALEFFAEGKLPGTFDGETFCANWTTYIEAGIGAIFGLFRAGAMQGAIGAMIWPEPNSGQKQAMEMFWFVTPEARGGGLGLLRRYEEWAAAAGAKQITMAHLHNLQPEKLKHLYERRGYRPIETHYIKEI